MKHLLTITNFAIIFFTCTLLFSQNKVTSVSNGNWLDINTWDCPACIPLPGDSVIINHHVTLDTNWITTGYLEINSGASLKEDNTKRYFVADGKNFINNGTVKFNILTLSNGEVINNDSLIIDKYMYNATSFTNNGIITQTDSFTNSHYFLNSSTGIINIQDYYTDSIFINHGKIIAQLHTNDMKETNNGYLSFYNFTNRGAYINNDTIMVSNDFTNMGQFDNNEYMSIANNFLNSDTSNITEAAFNVNGYVYVGHNWSNLDTLKGTSGNFEVEDSTANFGVISGTFTFCDKTPPPTSPYIDFNTGAINPSVQYCQNIDITEFTSIISGLTISPNPYSEKTTINYHLSNKSRVSLSVFDAAGNIITIIVDEMQPAGNHEYRFSNNKPGIYIVKLKAGDFISSKKIIKE